MQLDDRVANQLAALSPDGVVVTDAAGHYRWANLAAARLVGVPGPEDLLGRYCGDDAATGTSAATGRERCKAALAGKTVHASVEVLRHADGRMVPVEISSAPYDLDGAPAVLSIVRDLSERYAAEAAEAALHLQHQTTLETLAEGVVLWSVDGDGRCTPVLINSAMRDIFGPDVADIVRSLAGVGAPPDLRDASGGPISPGDLPLWETVRTGRRNDGFVLGVDVAGREPVWVRLASRPVLGSDDLVVGVVVSMTDITAEHEASRLLRRAHARFAALVEHSADVITVLDAAGVVVYASPAHRSVYGEDPAGRVGSALADRLHPDDRDDLRATLDALRTTPGETATIECRVVLDAGEVRHLELTATNHLDHPAVEGVVVNTRDVTERVATAQRLAHQARHDALTGLSNRAALDERLPRATGHAKRPGRPYALLFVDLDHFKAVNDSSGHGCGDELLTVMAERIAVQQRPEDLVCRLGGDEFVVVVDDISTPEEVEVVAERIRLAVRRPARIGGAWLQVTCSIGVALSDGEPPERVLYRADLALYAAKERGRDRWALQGGTEIGPRPAQTASLV